MSRLPAILGGEPAFDPPLPFARPTVEDASPILRAVERSLESGRITNGPLVRQLEDRVRDLVGVDHCVAVSSCTSGLILLIQAIGPTGPVVMPSFTFSATAHAARWNGADIVFADCNPETWCLAPGDIHDDPALIIGVHVSGVPCDVEGLQRRAKELGATLIFDAAHGAGSQVTVEGARQGLGAFGLAEVFSLTPTKVLSGAEGGLITTNDEALADHLRVALQYGDPGNYDTGFAGLNARLSELHAAVALTSLDHLEERVAHRNLVASVYREVLSGLPGVGFQVVPDGSRSSYKDFSVLIDADRFGARRDTVSAALEREGIEHRAYYSPPVHMQEAYDDLPTVRLPVTERLASQVISLPIWSHIPISDVERIGEAMVAIQARAAEMEERIAPVSDRSV